MKLEDLEWVMNDSLHNRATDRDIRHAWFGAPLRGDLHASRGFIAEGEHRYYIRERREGYYIREWGDSKWLWSRLDIMSAQCVVHHLCALNNEPQPSLTPIAPTSRHRHSNRQ